MEYSWRDFGAWSDRLWELRDKRVDGWFMLDSFWPTLLLVAAYLFIVKVWGPRFMENRPPYNINTFLIYYNAAQVGLSAYIVIQLIRAGWLWEYSFRCQPVDYSQSPKAMLVSIFFFLTLGAFTFYVDKIFRNFDPSLPICRQFIY